MPIKATEKNVYRSLVVLLAILCCAAWMRTGVQAVQQEPNMTEGEKPYTPTRLEWMALYFNVHHRIDEDSFSIRFHHRSARNEITIVVLYANDVDHRRMNQFVKQAREDLVHERNQLGWDSWLRIKEVRNSVDEM